MGLHSLLIHSCSKYSSDSAQFYMNSVLQIKRGERDNSGMVFHITSLKCML